MMNHLEGENFKNIEHRTSNAEHRIPAITVALVERVSHCIAMGIPLDLALAGESVTEEDYKEHLEQNPEFAAIEGKAKCKFIEDAIGALLRVENPSTNIRWLLERVYPEIFAKPGRDREQDAVVEKKRLPTIVGWTEEEVEEMRRQARLL
jgi:hypothetical protein